MRGGPDAHNGDAIRQQRRSLHASEAELIAEEVSDAIATYRGKRKRAWYLRRQASGAAPSLAVARLCLRRSDAAHWVDARSDTMKTATGKKDGKEEILHLAFLVYAEDSERWGRVWTARSVLTGQVAEGRSAESTVRNLQRTIDAEIAMAASLGQGIRDWHKAQRPDEPKYIEEWCRLAASAPERRQKVKISDFTLETVIVEQAA